VLCGNASRVSPRAVCCSVLQCFAVWQHVELPCRVGVPLESALNIVSRMGPCGARATHVDEKQCSE